MTFLRRASTCSVWRKTTPSHNQLGWIGNVSDRRNGTIKINGTSTRQVPATFGLALTACATYQGCHRMYSLGPCAATRMGTPDSRFDTARDRCFSQVMRTFIIVRWTSIGPGAPLGSACIKECLRKI